LSSGCRSLRATIPVIFLTALSDDIYEQAPLEGGAVDFIDKARRLPILLKRLQLIAQGGRSAPEPEPVPASSLRLGQLMRRGAGRGNPSVDIG
jgi:two-component system response regulator ChvI